jgi:hypothetical protein
MKWLREEVELLSEQKLHMTQGQVYDTSKVEMTDTCPLPSNNKSEKLFAGHKTMVYLHTHHPYQWEPEKENKTKSINSDIDSISGNFLLYDICLVMEAKFKLKSIQENLSKEHPSDIKGALSEMSGYLNVNPYHLGEYGRRTKYIYRIMGVKDLWGTVLTQGNLSSSAREIELNEHLSHRVFALTAITVVIGALSLMVSILCCNYSNNSSDMSNCFFSEVQSFKEAAVLLLAACYS